MHVASHLGRNFGVRHASYQHKRKPRKGSKKDGVAGGLVCRHSKKAGELDTMKRCGRCGACATAMLQCSNGIGKRVATSGKTVAELAVMVCLGQG